MYVDLSCFKSDNLSRMSRIRLRISCSVGSSGACTAGELDILWEGSVTLSVVKSYAKIFKDFLTYGVARG